MHTIYLNSNKLEEDIEEITHKFEEIFTNIAKIEDILNEDNFLEVTIKTFFNDLKYRGIDDISKYLEENNNDNIPNRIMSLRDHENTQKYNISNKIYFINDFVEELVNNGEYLSDFKKDDSKFFYVHSIISLGISVDIYPFIVFLYKKNIDKETKKNFIEILENLLIRNRVITTRKRLSIELNWRYQSLLDDSYNFVEDINEQFETEDFTWSNYEFIKFLNNEISHPTAKFLLWKYESYLLKKENMRYDDKKMKKITLEHIAPVKEEKDKNKKYGGFDRYDSKFERLIYCIGNYLLLKEDKNKGASNSDFKIKLEYYNNQDDNIKLEQQKEIIDNYFNKKTMELKFHWDKKAIETRTEKIIKAIKSVYNIKE